VYLLLGKVEFLSAFVGTSARDAPIRWDDASLCYFSGCMGTTGIIPLPRRSFASEGSPGFRIALLAASSHRLSFSLAADGNDNLLLSSPVTVAGPLRVLTAFRSSDTGYYDPILELCTWQCQEFPRKSSNEIHEHLAGPGFHVELLLYKMRALGLLQVI